MDELVATSLSSVRCYTTLPLADADILERLLTGAGLKAVRVTRETRVHRFTSFDEYWQPFETGGGRHGQLYMRLSVPVRLTVRDTVRRRMRPFCTDGCLEMEADVFFGAGER